MAKSFLESLFSLIDKVVVLTGGGGFIAGAMAKAVSKCGAKVAVLDISDEAAQKIRSDIVREGGSAIALRADVLDKSSLQKACRKVISEFGKVDCLVNGAGGNKKEATTSDELSFFDIPIDANKWVFDLNFVGTFLACQVFGKEIAKQKKGSIVNIASISGFRPLTRAAAYAAAKAAVINFTRWLSVHIAQNYSKDIRVNAIAPGFCATEQNRYLLFDKDGQLTERGKTILKSVPQNRFGEPNELVGAAIWLLSGSASFATGSVVTIDGGFDAFSGV
jgi:NAD(P)-dependent dehydrogenase (short-subunit alcohol dehydrogenase family)